MSVTSKVFSYDRSFPRGQMVTPAAEIRQIAELSVIRGGEIREHIQNCDEITLAVSGKATVYSGENVYEMTAGQIHFIRTGEYHKIVADPAENFRYCCIGYLPGKDAGIGAFLDAIKDKRDFLVEDQGDIRSILERLIEEFYIRDEESNAMIHYYFCQMLITLYRILCGKSKEKLSKINTSTSNQAVYRALKYIDSEYLRIEKVAEVAQVLNYSEYYLSHVFREKMDMTMKEYILQKKLQMAATWLETSNMSITEISDQLHFAGLHSFGIAFKRYMGMSPSEYRRQSVNETRAN